MAAIAKPGRKENEGKSGKWVAGGGSTAKPLSGAANPGTKLKSRWIHIQSPIALLNSVGVTASVAYDHPVPLFISYGI